MLWIGFRLQKKSLKPAWSKESFENMLVGLFMSGVLGGRLGFFLFYSPEVLWQAPVEILKIWQGGMSIHGGLLGGGAWLCFVAYKEKYKFLSLTDVLVIPLSLALMFGRLANFLNGELVGTPTDQTWGMIFPHIDDLYRHPSQLYEMAKNASLFLILNKLFAQKMWKKRGFLTGAFLLGYGVLRFLIEFVREPDGLYWGISTGQWLCIIMMLVSFWLFRQTKTDRLPQNSL